MESTDASTNYNAHAASAFNLAEREERLVASLEAFLHAWAEGKRKDDRWHPVSSTTTAAMVAREDEQQQRAGSQPHLMLCASNGDAALHTTARMAATPSTSTSTMEYLATLPPCLPVPLPRSFRPNEMMPGVYLGSWSDIGINVLELARRLSDASTSTYESSLCPGSRSRQRLVLLVRACPLKGIVTPRLELRVTWRREGARRSRLSTGKAVPAPARLLQQPSKRPLATHSGQRPDEDVVVSHMSLNEVYKRVCAVVATEAADPTVAAGVRRAEVMASRESEDYHHAGPRTGASSSAISSGVSTVARWLCPDSPLSSPSRSALPDRATAANVPSGCTPADWRVFVRAMQWVLTEEASVYTPAGAALKREEVAETAAEAAHCRCSGKATAELRYWRLILPILDSPGTRMQHYTPMTTLIMHAALALEEHPQGRAWLQGQQRQVVRNNAPASDGRAVVVDIAGDVGRCEEKSAGAAEAIVFPCVAVHCQAGKSRSVAFVAAFLLHEWMWWYRGCYPLITAGTDTITAEQQQQQQQQQQRSRQSNIARRLVDTVLSHLRRRRLCIDINLGFDAQLWEMMGAFVRSL
ncbi:putative Dual specificity phosphatase, catalytic domain containing protein [Leishmania utingensis]|uniref:Dual specificity phosphatase, catalytic domain containing protein n=1 Tax=Leishmania utingensis TaxID=653362 RepID=A0AAW3AU56_9TRYP